MAKRRRPAYGPSGERNYRSNVQALPRRTVEIIERHLGRPMIGPKIGLGRPLTSVYPREVVRSRRSFAVPRYTPLPRRDLGRSPRLGRFGISRSLVGIPIWSPRKISFCVRRHIRREVLFALGVSGGSGVGRGKRWKRTAESAYSC